MKYILSVCVFLLINVSLAGEDFSKKTAKDYFDEASAIRKTEPQKALELYLKAYDLRPDSSFYAARIGQHYYYELREMTKSLDYYRKAIDGGFKGEWAIHQYIKVLRWMLHFSFAENDWKACEEYINEIDSIIKKIPEISEKFPEWETRKLLIKKRISYGENIKSEYTHKILVVLINDIETKYKKDTIKCSLNEKDRELTKLSAKCLANYVSALTEGKIDIYLQWAEWNEPVAGLKITDKDKYVLDVEKVSLEMSSLLTDKLKDIDTVFLFWPSHSSQTAHGGATKFLLDNGNKKVWRGVAQIPAMRMTINGPWLVVHEFFHVVENMTGIRSRHGFREENRDNFPEWKGETELDYYYWQLGTNIEKIFNSEEFADNPGWTNFNFKDRYFIRSVK